MHLSKYLPIPPPPPVVAHLEVPPHLGPPGTVMCGGTPLTSEALAGITMPCGCSAQDHFEQGKPVPLPICRECNAIQARGLN